MLLELQKVQSSTASLVASLQTSVHNSTPQLPSLPPQFQETYTELTNNLSAAVTELRTIVSDKDLPLQEKVGRMGHEVHERVSPLLETIRKGVSELLARGKEEASEVRHEATTNGSS